ncbi:MAG: hypothetical protein II937_01055 [Bacteroidales bacterium]|nr:hypothetical protein [Bacteroidales bacterium]
MKKTLFLILPFCFLGFKSFAQRLEIKGFQYRQEESDAVLECEGIKISRTMVIDSVSCNCDGFWVMKGKEKSKKPVKAFWSEKSVKRAIGYELKPETYFIYPNIKEDSMTGEVTVWLKRK